MSKERLGLLLAIAILTWSAYFICALIFGHGLWVVKALSLASTTALVVFVFTVLKNEGNKNDLTD